MTVNFTVDDVIEQVRGLASANPDYVYEQPARQHPKRYGETGLLVSCFYVHEEINPPGHENSKVPGCIFGQAFNALGVSLETLERFEGLPAWRVLVNLMVPGVTLSEKNRTSLSSPLSEKGTWIQNVQMGQDRGYSWSRAVAEADRELEMIAAGKGSNA